jgi:hypothetical protein
MESFYLHPADRKAIIKENLSDIATDQLQKLFREVEASVPSARLTKSGDAFIIPSSDNKSQLIVTIPIIGNNSLALCSSLMGNVSELQMSWVVFTAPSNELIVCTVKPERYPMSASKIIAWAQSE